MSEEVKLVAPDGEILARDNLVLAVFGRRPFVQMAAGARAAIEQWWKAVPSDELRWALVGKSSTKYTKLTPQVLKRALAMLDDDVTRKNDVYFEILGPDVAGPDYLVLVKGYKQPAKIGFSNQTNLVEFHFPVEFLSRVGADRVAELASSIFSAMPCDSGYASLALSPGIRGDYDKAADFIAPRALQHHGYDVHDNPASAALIGPLTRGARWLTMLSAPLVEQVGGVEALKRQVAPGVDIQSVRNGLVIRAGSEPEVGSVNRGQRTTLVASVAQAIENITCFGDNAILPLFKRQKERRDRWERRFWWHEE